MTSCIQEREHVDIPSRRRVLTCSREASPGTEFPMFGVPHPPEAEMKGKNNFFVGTSVTGAASDRMISRKSVGPCNVVRNPMWFNFAPGHTDYRKGSGGIMPVESTPSSAGFDHVANTTSENRRGNRWARVVNGPYDRKSHPVERDHEMTMRFLNGFCRGDGSYVSFDCRVDSAESLSLNSDRIDRYPSTTCTVTLIIMEQVTKSCNIKREMSRLQYVSSKVVESPGVRGKRISRHHPSPAQTGVDNR
jgi:hypothetical protein